MQIKLYNSVSKEIEELQAIDKNSNLVRIYSCGPTVYNYAHIGNLRSFLVADLIQRVIKHIGGFQVKWVMNITDIDDKTIKGSAVGSVSWLKVMGEQTESAKENLKVFTEYYIKEFISDIGKVGIKSEDFYKLPKATDYIPQMQSLVKKIFDNGFAYVSEGSVYFSIRKWQEKSKYGVLKTIDFENFVAGERVDSDEYEKESAFDFVLWKYKKDGEPFWEFELDGQDCSGRPGWHLECSAMEKHILGLPFEIHTGGVDLRFPHHEDEIAQSAAGYGVNPTKYWCHNEFLEVEGKKMSKSLGNFFTLKDLAEKNIDYKDLRFAMLSAHYRSIYNFTFADIESSRKGRLRLQEFIYLIWGRFFRLQRGSQSSLENNNQNLKEIDFTTEIGRKFESVFLSLANDFHVPKALAATYSIINNTKVEDLKDEEILNFVAFFYKFNSIFEVFELTQTPKEVENQAPPEVVAFAEERLIAKKMKNWEEADSLRRKIDELSWIIKDTKDGYSLEKKR